MRISAFEHAQNVQIYSILPMRKVSSEPLMDSDTFCSIQLFSSRKHDYIILTPLNPSFM